MAEKPLSGRNDEWDELPRSMRSFARNFGPEDGHVLLLGPPGAGKGHLARILHDLGPRAAGPFLQHNSGVVTESLAEATLFGFAKGAFTGATDSRAGVVEAAGGGTLFLDELGALPYAIQAMFLLFLETGELRRLGSTKARKVDVRVIAATNRDLGEAIRAEEFRRDLVSRFPFRYVVPPLRERREEIPGIVNRHLRANGAACELTDGALSRLRSHHWPGNIRELVSVIRWCTTLAKNGLIDRDLVEAGMAHQRIGMPSDRNGRMEGTSRPKSHEEKRRELVDALAATGGNKSEAAKLIGIHRSTVYRRLIRYGL